MGQEGFLNEFLIFPAPPELNNNLTIKEVCESTVSHSNKDEKLEFVANWTNTQTKVLLDLYKQYRSKVGTFEIKNLKKLWEVIATNINAILKTNYTASHVENRWRVVERSYKKFVDNKNKTGRGRKYFEYEEEMDDIFKGKKNVKPDVLLSTDTVENLVEEIEANTTGDQGSISPKSTVVETPGKILPLKRRKLTPNRTLTIEQLRRDRKEYNKERIEVEKKKIEIQNQKIILMRERNELLRERNELIRNRTCSSCSKEFG